MKTTTQNARLLNWLQSHDGITSLEATLNLGITQLSARISELEHEDVLIARDPEKTPGGARVYRYRIERVPYG